MSEVIETEAVEGKQEPEDQDGVVNIRITDNSVKYDTNLSTPELIFWIKIVENMIIKQVVEGGSENE